MPLVAGKRHRVTAVWQIISSGNTNLVGGYLYAIGLDASYNSPANEGMEFNLSGGQGGAGWATGYATVTREFDDNDLIAAGCSFFRGLFRYKVNYSGSGSWNNTDQFKLVSLTFDDITSENNALNYANNASASAATATAQAAAASSSATLAAQVGSGDSNLNSMFASWPNASGFPTYWADSSAGSISQVAGITSPYALRGLGTAGVNNYIIQGAGNAPWAANVGDWIVLEADIKLNSGSLSGAGILYRVTGSGDITLNLSVDPTTSNSVVGAGVAGKTYAYRKLVQISSGANSGSQFYLMNHWSPLGSIAATNDITWYRCGWRPASAAEIKTGQIDNLNASVTTNQGAIATLQGKTSAYWQVATVAGSSTAAISAVANGTSSGIELQADAIRLGSSKLAALDIVNGQVQIHGQLQIGSVDPTMLSPTAIQQTSTNLLNSSSIWGTWNFAAAAPPKWAWNNSAADTWYTGTGPSGTAEMLMQMTSNGTQANGGWSANLGVADGFDSTKTYRYYTWVNQVSGDQSLYHGTGQVSAVSGGAPVSNPYFMTFSKAALTVNKWYLMVGIVHGSGWTGGSSGQSGVYDPVTGQQVIAGTDYRWTAGVTTATFRSYQYYGTANGGITFFTRPVVEEVVSGRTSAITALFQTLDPAQQINAGTTTIDGGKLTTGTVIADKLLATTEIALGTGTDSWPVALRAKDYLVTDGQAVSFGINLGAIPQLDFSTNNLDPLPAGSTYHLYADPLTSTGFTARLRAIVPGTPSNYTVTTDAAGGSGDPTRVATIAAPSSDGSYQITFTGHVTATSRNVKTTIWAGTTTTATFGIWAKAGGVWTKATTYSATAQSQPSEFDQYENDFTQTNTYQMGSGVTAVGVTMDTCTNASGNQYGSAGVSAITNVQWTAAGTSSSDVTATSHQQTVRVTVRPQ